MSIAAVLGSRGVHSGQTASRRRSPRAAGRGVALALLLAAHAPPAACAGAYADPTVDQATVHSTVQATVHSSVEATDDTGRRVALAHPAQRIVSLAPHATELLFDIGAGDEVVGVSDFSDYPAQARGLPRVGGSQGVDLERVARLRPDLVVAWTSGNSPREVEAIERLGIPVFRSDPHSLGAIAQNLEKIGLLTGHREAGIAAARQFLERVDALREQYRGRPAVRVFYQVWDKPLMTVGGPHLISHVMSLCGGRNIFASLDALAPEVDAEAVIRRDPEVIALASDLGRGKEELAAWRTWPALSAVRNEHLLVMDPALITRPTPRIAEGARILCAGIDAARRP